ncbi:sulfotransferase family 2 domain-containing protein [uncultured Erythrobacter sp.]|nr:sulfotransferase family 2 domain-containing protein [uncultured Erythrobacter sp.]
MRLAELSNKLARITNRAGFEVSLRRVLRSTQRRRVVYFLHIGKAAGSQVKQMMAQVNRQGGNVHMKAQSHDVTLADLPEPSDYFFSIRDPISRFRSGFYSRKRRGRPLNDIAWTPHEETAFANFEHAADLAEALFAPGEQGLKAASAMKSIRHTAQDQIDWFALAGDIFTVRPPVWVLRQEHLEADLKVLIERLGLDFTPEPRRDTKGAHANDYSGIPELTETGIANLKLWYAQDFAFYEAVETWMALERGE